MTFPNEINDIDKMKFLSSIGFMKACDENQVINYINPWGISIDWHKLITFGKNGSIIYVKIGNMNQFLNNLKVKLILSLY